MLCALSVGIVVDRYHRNPGSIFGSCSLAYHFATLLKTRPLSPRLPLGCLPMLLNFLSCRKAGWTADMLDGNLHVFISDIDLGSVESPH